MPAAQPEREMAPDLAPAAAPPVVPLRIGDYRVVRLLGAGSVAEVYEAVREAPDRAGAGPGQRVAVKVLQKELAEDEQVAARFLQAAEAAAAADHPGLVPPLEWGVLEDGAPYVVTEFVEGTSLRQVLAGRVGVTRAMQIGQRLAQALAAAHSVGVVHRDLKPEGIVLLAGTDQPRILDLGAARVSAEQRASRASVPPLVSRPQRQRSTQRYLSPEQWRGAAEITDRADVYALGAILYEMLGGGPPFASASASEVMALHLLQTPPPLRARRPEAPAMLTELVHRMLAKDPAERPAMVEVESTLETLRGVRERRLQRQRAVLRALLSVVLLGVLVVLLLTSRR